MCAKRKRRERERERPLVCSNFHVPIMVYSRLPRQPWRSADISQILHTVEDPHFIIIGNFILKYFFVEE